jgi:threonine dehydrogenase-like Zn-dependent dehydrogenase
VRITDVDAPYSPRLNRLISRAISVTKGQLGPQRAEPRPPSREIILPLLTDDDPLGVDEFATHHVPLEQAPQAYADFRDKKNGTVKVLLKP